MKKLMCLALGLLIAISFAGCTDFVRYTVPSDCCIVSVQKGTDIVSDSAHTLKKIDGLIKGVKKSYGMDYWAVTKGAKFSLINYDEYYCNGRQYGYGQVIEGFNVEGEFVPYKIQSGEHFTLSCDKNTEIIPVYTEFETVGLIVFVADDDAAMWEKIYNFASCFDEDGMPKEIADFYYLICYDKEVDTLPDYLNPLKYWNTNLNYTGVEFTNVTATYTVERPALSEGQQLTYCVLNRYDETQYFLAGLYGDGQTAELMSMTVDIGKDYQLILKTVKSAEA